MIKAPIPNSSFNPRLVVANRSPYRPKNASVLNLIKSSIMRAQLARHARRILIQQSRLPSCALYSAPTRRRQLYSPVSPRVCNRTFIGGLFEKAPREVRQPEFEPGWMQIMVWRSRMLDNLRPPPPESLMAAWKAFFESKLSTRVPVNATQALQCRRLLEYLLQQPGESAKSAPPIWKHRDVNVAFDVLMRLKPRERTQHHLDFAKSLYQALDTGNLLDKADKKKSLLWARYVKIISLYGGAKEALQEVYANWDDAVSLFDHSFNVINPLVEGLVREGLESELLELLERVEAHESGLSRNVHASVTKFFAKQDRIAETKYWFEKGPKDTTISSETYTAIAEFAARNNLQDWAIPYFLALGETKPSKSHWDSLLQAILILGKGLKEVENIIPRMTDSKGQKIEANITTINQLLRVAVSTQNPILAEDILAMAMSRGLQMNGETYLILMQLRLNAGYLAGVHAAYKQVRQLEPWQNDPQIWWEFSHLLNDYIEAICIQKQLDAKLLQELIENAEEDRISLEPKRVAALCVRLLENEQHFDVMDILSVHAFQYSAEEREIIQEAFTNFCLNKSTTTNRAWTCYQLLRQFFQDLSFEHRVQLMESFFRRKRPDMASHVFGHMRQHRNKVYHPKLETYTTFFEGIAQHPDTEALEMVYNMLKMDTSVQPNTKLYTALILSHASCDKALQAMDFWAEITASREGPTYASLEAVFWALEKKPGGEMIARNIWNKIERMDVEITPAVYNAYIGATAGSGKVQETKQLIQKMSTAVGAEPDFMTLGIAYNALPGQGLQSDFLQWAKALYPQVCAELNKKGRRMNELSLCQFKINRILKA